MINQILLHPQEIEVFYILPTLRRELAIQMKNNGLKQNKIAELLNIESATVSQYINEKRGNKIELNEEIKKEIAISANKITDKLSLLRETQKLLRLTRNSGFLCKIHKQFSNVPNECNPQLIECFGDEKDANARVCY